MSAASELPSRADILARRARLGIGVQQPVYVRPVPVVEPAPVAEPAKSVSRFCYLRPVGPFRFPVDATDNAATCGSPTNLITQFCKTRAVSIEDIRSQKQHQAIVLPRHELMWLLKENTTLTLFAIGDLVNRDHAAVINGIKKHITRSTGEKPTYVAKRIKIAAIRARVIELSEQGLGPAAIAKVLGNARCQVDNLLYLHRRQKREAGL